jgi:hypothetical protein
METLPFAECDFHSSHVNLARSTPSTISAVLDIIQSTKIEGKLIDIGCGDGRIVLAASQRGIDSFGIDLDQALIDECNLSAGPLATFAVQDMYLVDLTEFSIMVCYIYQNNLFKLKGQFKRRLEKGNSILVTILYPIPNWNPIKFDPLFNIFVYDLSSIVS